MYNWREIPLIRILIPFVLGILLALEIDQAFPFLDYCLIFLLILFGYLIKERLQYKFRWVYGVFVNMVFMMLGYQLCFYHTDQNRNNHFKQWITKENIVIGTVDNAPTNLSKYIRINLKTQEIASDSMASNFCQGTVQLSILNNKKSRKIAYGDLMICRTKLRKIRPSLNPLAFDYKKYLHLNNIDYQGFVKEDAWSVLEKDQGNPILSWAFTRRALFLNILKSNLNGKNEIAVGSALILGFKEGLNEELKTAYANTGAMHVLAVSGLHVGLIWGFVVLLIGWIRWRNPVWKWIKVLFTLMCLWMFALITGASPSVLRAATMFSFVIVGTSLGRSVSIYNTLAASAFCLLLYNPFLIKEVGFQLSYFAVIGIVYFQPKVYRLWFIKNKAGNFLWKLTAVAIAAQLTTFPLSLFYFHQFPLYFWLSGIIVVPFAFLILGGGIFLFIAHTILPFLEGLIGTLLNGVIWLMNALIFLIEQIPSGLLSGIWIGLATVILLYLFILFISFSINSKRFRWVLRGMVFMVIIFGIYAFRGVENQMNKAVVFYHIPGKSYAEFIDGEQVISFGDLKVDSKKLGFATSEFHLANGVKTKEKYHFGYEDVQLDNWMHTHGIVQFYDRKIAFLKHLPSVENDNKLSVDFVLIRRGATFDLKDLEEQFSFKKIIVDAGLEFQKRQKWQLACAAENIPFHDINSKGALILKAKKSDE